MSADIFSPRVDNDGGLRVVAISPNDVQQNIWDGRIRSGQAALTQWAFYLEVMRARQDQALFKQMTASGYLTVSNVSIG